jgi:pseudaminic acid cytidylyltransferase
LIRSVAIITARGGSKRIPRKNIRPFLGVPIIKYPIDSAFESGCFDEVMVSSDDAKIMELAKSFGAKVPFPRSDATADDRASLADVVAEVIACYEKIGRCYEYFCCLLPTAPFVTSQRLRESFSLLQETGADAVIPVVRFNYPIQRALRIENGHLRMACPENRNVRSQDLEPTYHDCGQFYWMKTSSFLTQRHFFADKTVPMEISEWEAQDIDTEEDWTMAEIKYRILQSHFNKKIDNGMRQS